MPRWILAVVALGLVAAAAGAGWLWSRTLDGPWGMLPGGRLEGAAEPCRSGWDAIADLPEIEVEVRPAAPRSVTTWSVVHDGALFVPADFLTPWKRWPHQVLEDDRVRLRAGGRIFECRAERVEDADLIERLRSAIAAKYDIDPDGRAAEVEVWWFRVRPR